MAQLGPRSMPRGQAMVEMSLVITLVLVLSVAVFEFGRAFITYISLVQAAREGARIAMSVDDHNTPGTSAQIRAAAENAALPLVIPDADVSILCSYGGDPQWVQIVVSSPFNTIVPLFDQFVGGGTGSINLQRSNVVPVPRCPP